MMSSNLASGAGSFFAVIEYHVLKVAEHRRRRTPDAPAAVIELVRQEPRAVSFEVTDAQGAAVEDDAQRHLEHAGDLARIRRRDELAIAHDADDGPHCEARACDELVERAYDLDDLGIE